MLGHWGTCPGLTLVYAHLNYLTRKNDLDLIYVVGPGHGAPAILASLWLEGSLARFYPEYSEDAQGLHNLITGFSTPHGFPIISMLKLLVLYTRAESWDTHLAWLLAR
jgi:xylulose-5-phosphate/fructose-6-phosphate phosphoketolase